MKKLTTLAGGDLAHPKESHGDILIQHKNEPRIDSRVISERAGIQHESLIATIKNHQARLRELGTLPRQTVNEYPDLKSEKSNRKVKRGRPEISYLLNEAQLDFIMRIVRGRDAEQMNQFKLDVTKSFARRRVAEPVRREYLPGYHESRNGLKALGAQRHHYINLANAENRAVGLVSGERSNANEHQLGVLICMQKIEQSTLQAAIDAGMSPTEAVREVAKRMDMFASLMAPTVRIGG